MWFLNRATVSRVCFQERRQSCMMVCFELIRQFADDWGIILFCFNLLKLFLNDAVV